MGCEKKSMGLQHSNTSYDPHQEYLPLHWPAAINQRVCALLKHYIEVSSLPQDVQYRFPHRNHSFIVISAPALARSFAMPPPNAGCAAHYQSMTTGKHTSDAVRRSANPLKTEGDMAGAITITASGIPLCRNSGNRLDHDAQMIVVVQARKDQLVLQSDCEPASHQVFLQSIRDRATITRTVLCTFHSQKWEGAQNCVADR